MYIGPLTIHKTEDQWQENYFCFSVSTNLINLNTSSITAIIGWKMSQELIIKPLIMKVIVTTLFLTCLIHYCQRDCQQRVKSNLYPASNRVLLNHGFKWKTVPSPVICGRDCSMDPHCASFNYYTWLGQISLLVPFSVLDG